MLGYLSADIICSEQRTDNNTTVSYEEQIMSKDKYPNIFSPQMEAIVVIILQIFFATRAVFKIGEYPRIFPSFSWGIFAHVTRLDQSRASENIWSIIRAIIIHQIFSLARDWSKLENRFSMLRKNRVTTKLISNPDPRPCDKQSEIWVRDYL